jgi:predicted methyltransferase
MEIDMKRLILAGAALCAMLAGPVALSAEPTSYVAAALNDPRRSADQSARDPLRKPAEILAFTGVKPGDKVADLIPGGGYFTRLFSVAVGPRGRVYGIIPEEMARNCSPEEFAGAHQVEHDGSYANVRILTRPMAAFDPPEPVDVEFTAQNYHDLFDSFMEHADVGAVDRALFRGLKPGGVLVVVDHVAEPGSGLRDTETLHRIDPAVIQRRLEAVGFVLEAHSDVLRNPADDHAIRVFDKRVRGHTDQVVLRFRKPAASG